MKRAGFAAPAASGRTVKEMSLYGSLVVVSKTSLCPSICRMGEAFGLSIQLFAMIVHVLTQYMWVRYWRDVMAVRRV